MNVSLTKELEEFVHQKVASGMYHSASEVVREALRALVQQENLHNLQEEQLRKDIAAGLEQADRGELIPLQTSEQKRRFAEGVRARGRQLIKQRKIA